MLVRRFWVTRSNDHCSAPVISETPTSLDFFSRASSRHLVDWWRRLVPPTLCAGAQKRSDSRDGRVRSRATPPQTAETDNELIVASGVAGCRSDAGHVFGAELVHYPGVQVRPRVGPAARCGACGEGTPEGCRPHSAGESRASLAPVSHLPEEYTAPAAVSLRH